MKWSLKLGSVAGIGIFVHWTFVLLVGGIFFMHLLGGEGLSAALAGAGFMLAIFGCVVLHELGHALAALHYGIKTRDIILLPIGGLARLERMPEKPMQELWVALAGPAVNVVIAGVLFGIVSAVVGFGEGATPETLRNNFLVQLMGANIFLALFNLLPAFPMDGGRVLRALLATRLNRARATAIAAKVGQAMAILFAIGGFFISPMLMLIAVFVFFGAQAEAETVEVTSALSGMSVRDAMLTRFRTMRPDDSLQSAVQELLAGSQQDFPVMDDHGMAGMLFRSDLMNALANARRDGTVAGAMTRGCRVFQADEPLNRALEVMRLSAVPTLPVMEGSELIGILTAENIGELVMVNSALRKSEPEPAHA